MSSMCSSVAGGTSLWLVRFEKVPPLAEPPFAYSTPTAVVLFTVPILGITAYGLDLPLAALSLVTTLTALWRIGGLGRFPRSSRDVAPS